MKDEREKSEKYMDYERCKGKAASGSARTRIPALVVRSMYRLTLYPRGGWSRQSKEQQQQQQQNAR